MAIVNLSVQSIENTQIELKTMWENLQLCKETLADCESIYQGEKDDLDYVDSFIQWRVGYDLAYELFKGVEQRMRGKDLSDVVVDDYLVLIPPYVINQGVGSPFTILMDDTAGSLLVTAQGVTPTLFDYFLADDGVIIAGTYDGATQGIDDGAYTINTVLFNYQLLMNEGRVIAPAYDDSVSFSIKLSYRPIDTTTYIYMPDHTPTVYRLVYSFNGLMTRIKALQTILERMDARLVKLNNAIGDMSYNGYEYATLNELLFDAYTELNEKRLLYVAQSELIAVRPAYSINAIDHEVVSFSFVEAASDRIELDINTTALLDNIFIDDLVKTSGSSEANNNSLSLVTVVTALALTTGSVFTNSSAETTVTLKLYGEYIV